MKIRLLLIFSVCFTTLCYAQVGINTEDPQGLLHIKGTANDVVVKEGTGNVGIGTTDPSEKLHVVGDVKVEAIETDSMKVSNSTLVKGKTGLGTSSPTAKVEIIGTSTNSLRIEGNSNPTNYYMTSNSEGVGNWKYLRPTTQKINGVIRGGDGTNATSIYINQNTYTKVSDTDITLGKGKWLILAKTILRREPINTYPFFAEMELREDDETLYQVGLTTRYADGGDKIGIPQITAIVHIPDNTPRVYSVWAKTTSNLSFTFQSAELGTPYFYAIQLDDE